MVKLLVAIVIGALIALFFSGCAELSKYDNVPRQPMDSAKVYQTSGGSIIVHDRYGNKIMETYRAPNAYNRRQGK